MTFQVGQKWLGAFCASTLLGESIIVTLLSIVATINGTSPWRNIAIHLPF
jgi:hypothetical protein